jgi:hypothetical protein
LRNPLHVTVRKVTEIQMFQKELYSGIPNVAVWRVLTKTLTQEDIQTIHRSKTP